MSKFLIISVIFFAASSVALPKGTSSLDPRIVGGEPANIEDYPYQVSIIYIDTHFCGGSIISEKHVLTAAHCTVSFSASDFLVRAGSSIVNEDGVVKSVANIIQNQNFDSNTYDYDLSILEITDTFELSSKIAIIPLAVKDSEVAEDTLGTATGWGRLSENGPTPTQLQKVLLPLITTETCRMVYGSSEVTDQMFCAGYPEGGKDTCQGDSGGPYVIDGVQVGITSWGDGCGAMNSPGVYVKVSKVRDFIDEVINRK